LRSEPSLRIAIPFNDDHDRLEPRGDGAVFGAKEKPTASSSVSVPIREGDILCADSILRGAWQ